ncbi:pre-mRNA-splicing regulator female-lethal(2)D [Topomyia yanbarensis]|uniref:pre-mRNA-splicing regulator female-lethal(2)D n=1 Tax=Topomyia yanbarensis TaxID=2498891 RepID=UPI00273AED2D|nr:pre-mRNA-splicing regulator female-lethal(2)D [Topomyia yanbarensis]XP_058826941.1 pre-mRNA-splicing regulator female-lethal(2)D [Topomyia yanbarensis]
MQSAEDTSNLMDTDHNASLCASSPPLNCAAAVAVPAGTSGPGTVTGPGTAVPTVRTGESLEYHCRMLEEELQTIKDSEAKLKLQYAESQRRERILARRLAVKEQEMQDFASQIAELKTAQAPGQAALRSALLDPAVNILFQKLKCELQQTKAKLEETQNELSAWKFTPDSNTGKRLMAKCRLLYQENEELGKMTSNGRLAKLEGELALQKSYNEEVKKSQLELDDFLQEMDEDVEGMQSTIVFLQQELKSTKEEKEVLEKEVIQLRTYVNGGGSGSGSGEDGSSQIDTDPDPSAAVYLVNGSTKLKQSSSDQSESLLVYQNRTHCGGNNSNSGLLQNGGDELVNEQEQTIGSVVVGGSNNSSSRLSGNSNTSTGSNNKKVNNRTAKTVGGKKRNYTEEQDDEGAAGSEDEEDSGHYDDGSNNGKMLAPDSLELQQQEEEQILVSSNKRMTRSGKGKAPPKTLSVKKLRRASVLSAEPTEDDDTTEGFPSNGAN